MSNETKNTGRKRELFLIAGIMLTAALLLLFNRFYFSAPAAFLEVSQDGKTIETLDLSRDQSLLVKTPDGGENLLVIQDQEVFVQSANCPGNDCVRQGKIRENGQSIICAPHKMAATILGQ